MWLWHPRTTPELPLPVRQLWNFKAFSRRKDLSQVLHLYLYSRSGCWRHKQGAAKRVGGRQPNSPGASPPLTTFLLCL